MYDIIGDVHGYYSHLCRLLKRLGYNKSGRSFRHRSRRAVFVGDLIDRGPRVRDTLWLVRDMVERGHAIALMGNHEYNALCYHISEGDSHLRPHTSKNYEQIRQTLEDFARYPAEWLDFLDWFRGLPVFWQKDGLRVVHAVWDAGAVAFLSQRLNGKAMEEKFLRRSVQQGTFEYNAMETLLKGREVALPEGYYIYDKEFVKRDRMRVRWWLAPQGQTYRSVALESHDSLPDIPLPREQSHWQAYPETEPPVVVGHYWQRLPIELFAPNIACVDYSIAKQGALVAYRWDGEGAFDPAKFVVLDYPEA
jgi:hypothetical protein